MKKGCAFLAVAIVAGVIVLANLGAKVSSQIGDNDTDHAEFVSDAKAALSMKLRNPRTRELHLLARHQVLCGQVKHDYSKVGFVPFAYSHAIGLTVAEVWGKGEPEQLNRDYGCEFLPIAHSEEWNRPFWGGQPDGDTYIP